MSFVSQCWKTHQRWDRRCNETKHNSAHEAPHQQRIYHVQSGILAPAPRGINSKALRSFKRPWSETTEMQARPGASRSATSRKFPITVFLPCNYSGATLKLVRSWPRIVVESGARMPHALKALHSKGLCGWGAPAGTFVPKETDGIRE